MLNVNYFTRLDYPDIYFTDLGFYMRNILWNIVFEGFIKFG